MAEKTTSVRVPDKILDKVRVRARRENRTVQGQIAEMLAQALSPDKREQ